ncbi:Ribosome maturation factor RimP [Bacteroidales bacterium Barb6XT]|nr:Ribosome maturation factor RimP [Bacteroidales bacterium Barb6XT]OAV68902.1 Ribosome maturation factor RimP [Bacteroidales bacterium Barb6XT]
MIDKQKVVRLAEEGIAVTTHFLTDVTVTPDNVIVVEIDNDQAVSIDDCAALSRFIESRLDRDAEDYELEVGSAGVTSPFKVLRQYVKNIGNEVEVLLKKGVKLTGILKAADEQGIILAVEKQVKPEGAKRKEIVQEEHTYIYEEIKYTKYLIRFK